VQPVHARAHPMQQTCWHADTSIMYCSMLVCAHICGSLRLDATAWTRAVCVRVCERTVLQVADGAQDRGLHHATAIHRLLPVSCATAKGSLSSSTYTANQRDRITGGEAPAKDKKPVIARL
jgi:hypothetical protein